MFQIKKEFPELVLSKRFIIYTILMMPRYRLVYGNLQDNVWNSNNPTQRYNVQRHSLRPFVPVRRLFPLSHNNSRLKLASSLITCVYYISFGVSSLCNRLLLLRQHLHIRYTLLMLRITFLQLYRWFNSES